MGWAMTFRLREGELAVRVSDGRETIAFAVASTQIYGDNTYTFEDEYCWFTPCCWGWVYDDLCQVCLQPVRLPGLEGWKPWSRLAEEMDLYFSDRLDPLSSTLMLSRISEHLPAPEKWRSTERLVPLPLGGA